ncbi:hypothetical protein HDV63DRAFT_368226 [Trichoderma sp. SZMC 28014]
MYWIHFAAFLLTASAEALANSVSTCSASYPGKFEVTISKLGKRDIEKRSSCSGTDALLLTLNDGVLKDAKDRTGYIASNYQFQFDDPPQVNAIYTSGFSACSNGKLGLRGSTTFYQCQSGNFYNLYDRNWAPQCEPIEIIIIPCDGNTGGNGYGGYGRKETTIGSKVVQTTIVSAIADGQPQVHPTSVVIPICQIGDGQVQGHTTPCSGQSPASPISQISDGQVVHQPPPTKAPEAIPTATGSPEPVGPPVTQLPDGQPQGPGTKAPAGTGTLPKPPPPSSSPEVPVSDAAQLFSNVKMTIAILMFCNMLIGV